MAKIMETRCAEPSRLPDLARASAEIVGLHRRATPGREDQAVIFSIWPCFTQTRHPLVRGSRLRGGRDGAVKRDFPDLANHDRPGQRVSAQSSAGPLV